MKVGSSVEDDKRRLTVIRNEIGWDNMLVRMHCCNCMSRANTRMDMVRFDVDMD